MSLKSADRIQETTTSTGTYTTNVVLGGATTGALAFSTLLSNGDTCYYTMDDGAGNWEVGIGTYVSSGNKLTRATTPLVSSNSGSTVTFGAGTKNIWVDAPAAMLNTLIGLTSNYANGVPSWQIGIDNNGGEHTIVYGDATQGTSGGLHANPNGVLTLRAKFNNLVLQAFGGSPGSYPPIIFSNSGGEEARFSNSVLYVHTTTDDSSGAYVQVAGAISVNDGSGDVLAMIASTGVIFPLQHATSGGPTYVKGGMYFDTTLNKLRIGGASGWETVTSV